MFVCENRGGGSVFALRTHTGHYGFASVLRSFMELRHPRDFRRSSARHATILLRTRRVSTSVVHSMVHPQDLLKSIPRICDRKKAISARFLFLFIRHGEAKVRPLPSLIKAETLFSTGVALFFMQFESWPHRYTRARVTYDLRWSVLQKMRRARIYSHVPNAIVDFAASGSRIDEQMATLSF